MKKGISAFVLLLIMTSAYGNEESAVWSRLYKQASSLEQKYVLMQNIVELNDRDMIPVLYDALQELNIQRENITNVTDRQQQYKLTKLIVEELGDMKATDAAEEIFLVMTDVNDNPFLEASSIRALGDIGARQYVDQLALMLRNINLDALQFTTKQETETVVGALIYALERIKDPKGFSPVFYAATGRYSKKVNERADRAMKNMVDDPTDLLGEILKSETDFEVKRKVLAVEDASKASPDRKISLIIEALDQGLMNKAENVRESNSLSQLRIECAVLLKKYGISDLNAVPLLDDMIRGSFSSTETLTAIDTLGSSDSDEAATVLSQFLDELNKKRQSGYTFQNESLVRATINALGVSGNSIGKPALLEVEFSGWGGDTRRLAKAALEKIK